MKKLILLLALITVAALCGLSLWGSLRAEQGFRQLMLRVMESPDLGILETRYESGWLQSRALADLEIRGVLGESFRQWLTSRGREDVRGRVGIRIRSTIEHGYTPLLDWLTTGLQGAPVVARVETLLELDKETQSEISAVLGLMPPVAISSLIRASGVAESYVRIPAQRIESRLGADEGGGWALNWKGLRASSVYATDFGRVTANVQSAGFEGESPASAIALTDLSLHADLTRDTGGLLVGEMNVSIGSLRRAFAAEPASNIELAHWAMTQTNTVEAGRFTSTLHARVRAIRFGDESYGPGEVELALRNLDAASLAQLQDDGLSERGSSDSEPLRQISAEPAPMQRLLPDLLSRSPRLELRALRLVTPSGDVEARAHIGLDGHGPELLRNPINLPLAFNAQVEIGCPADVLESLYQTRSEQLEALRRDSWVLLEGDRYRSSLRLEQGTLTVNGVPKALGDLIGEPTASTELSQLEADRSGSEAVAPGAEPLP